MGPYNLTSGYEVIGQDVLPQSCNELWNWAQNAPPKHSHPCTRLYGVLTQTTLWILTTVNISNPVPRNIKNNWNVDGNVTLGKQNSRISVSFTAMSFNTTYFSTSCVHCVAYFVSKKLREWTIISINTHSGSGPHTNNFKIY